MMGCAPWFDIVVHAFSLILIYAAFLLWLWGSASDPAHAREVLPLSLGVHILSDTRA